MPRLPEDQLRSLVVQCLKAGASSVGVPERIEGHFEITLQLHPGGPSRTFHIAARTATRDTRIKDVWTSRLKIQKTGLSGVQHLDALLGFKLLGEDIMVASFEVAHHLPVSGNSNNVQFQEQLVLQAHQTGRVVSFRKPTTGERVEVFPGELLVPFLFGVAPPATPAPPEQPASPAAWSAPSPTSASPAFLQETPPNALPGFVVRRTLKRDPEFSARVQELYGSRCAACGASLGITEAAHLVPYALSRNNSPLNGVCLCPNHHTAFDLADLISFAQDRTIWVNLAKLRNLELEQQLEGWDWVIGNLYPSLLPVPAGVDQSRFLAERHTMDLAEGEWIRREELQDS